MITRSKSRCITRLPQATARFCSGVNEQLVKAKPAFHKKTFLKDFHSEAEFCSVCHKVSLPYELNHYKEFLRGQNHYDSYLLSGVVRAWSPQFLLPRRSLRKTATVVTCLLASLMTSVRKFLDDSGKLKVPRSFVSGRQHSGCVVERSRRCHETSAGDS